jgi:group I intron endonuclease
MACGIYQILNIATGKCYVGKSRNLDSRRYDHFHDLKSNNHHSIKLQRAWNKYGPDVWEWNILQECEESQLTWLEAFWMAKLNSVNNGYNVERLVLEDGVIRRRTLRTAPVSSETRKKLSAAGKGRDITWGDKISAAKQGKPQSDEHKKKTGDIHRGMKFSVEARARMSEAQKLRRERSKVL